MAILYRSFAASTHMLDELLDRGIPVVCKSHTTNRFDRAPYVDIIRLFTCVINPSDRDASRKVLHLMYLSRTQGDKAWDTARRKKIHWTEAVCQLNVPFFQLEYLEGMTIGIPLQMLYN